MTEIKLKQILLSTNYFIDNSFLDEYIKVVLTQGEDIVTSPYYIEKHHVIPVSFYKISNNISNREQGKKIADKDPNNFIVPLSYKNHCIAHYLLINCTIGSLKTSMRTAYLRMYKDTTRGMTLDDLKELEDYYDTLCFHINRDEIYTFYITENHTLDEVCEKYSEVPRGTLRKLLKRYGIIKQSQSAPKITKELVAKMLTDTEFITFATTHSHQDTAKKYGFKRNEVQRLMSKMGIKNYFFEPTTTGQRGGWNKGLTKEDANFYSEELLQKLSKANKGKHLSEERKVQLSNTNKGKKRSLETRKKISEAKKKKLRCIETNQIFNSIGEAANFVGVTQSSFYRLSNKCIGGYHWELIKEDQP